MSFFLTYTISTAVYVKKDAATTSSTTDHGTQKPRFIKLNLHTQANKHTYTTSVLIIEGDEEERRLEADHFTEIRAPP